LEAKYSDLNEKYFGEFRERKVTFIVQPLQVKQNIVFKVFRFSRTKFWSGFWHIHLNSQVIEAFFYLVSVK